MQRLQPALYSTNTLCNRSRVEVCYCFRRGHFDKWPQLCAVAMRIYNIAIMIIQSSSALDRRRILRERGVGRTRLFRTIQLYDRRPAMRGGGHDPRAADAAAVKTRLVVVAVVLL